MIYRFAALTGAVVFWTAGSAAARKPSIDFDKQVRPILEAHCFKCHGPDKQKGKLRLDTLSTDLLNDRPAAETWHDVRDVLNLGEMPPEEEPAMTAGDRGVLTSWIDAEIDAVIAAQQSTGGRPVMRRLTRSEYQNTMRDLLGIDMDYAKDLPPEGLSSDGFDNNGLALQMTDLQLEYYLQAARDGLAKAIVSGPEPEVFRHSFNTSSNDKGTTGVNQLGSKQQFLVKMMEYPDEGEFLVRVKARAHLVDGRGYPQLRATLGFRADTKGPRGAMAEIHDVQSEDWQTYEFRDRVEHYPLPSRTQSKFPGLLVVLDNAYAEGRDPKGKTAKKAKPKKPKKGEQPAKPKAAPPRTFPEIEIESLEFVGPVFDQWPPAHHTRILFDSPTREKDESAYAAEVLQRFMSFAFRRPVSKGEVAAYRKFFDTARPRLGSFEEAIRETLAMVLISPEFLYLVEPATGDTKRKVNDWELASRLSYFLWGSMPDERLIRLARDGKLHESQTLEGEVERLLADERSWRFVEGFAGQWLDVGSVDRVAVNPDFYPKFDNALKESMRGETLHFFNEILGKGYSALNLLDSNFTMLDEALAKHYGLEGPRGSNFEKVSLKPEDQRGGVLTHGSVLLGNSTGDDSHPVKRAVWIRERLLDDPPADPPPNVPNLDSTNPDFAKLSVREQLKAHREDPSCANCHRGIDPWGIALENYGGDGLWREQIVRKKGSKGVPVEAATTLPDGQAVSGMGELKNYLASERREQFARAFTTKLLTYSVGRKLELTDQKAVDELTANFVDGGYKIAPLIQHIVASDTFQSK